MSTQEPTHFLWQILQDIFLFLRMNFFYPQMAIFSFDQFEREMNGHLLTMNMLE